MKRIFCFMCLLVLTACDRPQYDMQMVCQDGAKGHLLVDAKVYETHVDLVVKRLTKELRAKAQGQKSVWLADHTWLYNQIPQIDDVIEITLPLNEADEYEVPGKMKFVLGHSLLTGGLTFTLWHATDNNLTMSDGEKIPDGQYLVGSRCEPVLYPVDMTLKNIPDEQHKEIKNCLAYLSEQMFGDTEKEMLVFDENTGREMYIYADTIKTIFNGMDPKHFFSENANHYPEDAQHACDIANRLREYIATHIDAEYIPVPQDMVSVSQGETMTISCDGKDIVIRGE